MAPLGLLPRPGSTAPFRTARPHRSGPARPRHGTAGRPRPPWSPARSAATASSARSTCSCGAPRCSWLS
eukprot:1903735-Alexandrium_andersonii.AAC.1